MVPLLSTDSPVAVAYLEHFPESGEGAHRLLLERFPFCIGRNASAHYCIPSRHVSKDHAQIVRDGGQLLIRDLGSTNGTFVNGKRVQEAVLRHGDIVHIGHKEFRFVQDAAAQVAEIVLTDHASGPLPASRIQSAESLKELLRWESVRAVFQVIVDLRTHAVLGHEALGRGNHERLNPSPAFLFEVAAQCSLAPELSRAFRRVALREAVHLPPGSSLFLNLHPAELKGDELWRYLEGLGEAVDGRPVVLEFHEEAVADAAAMRRWRDRLHSLGLRLAYDDFGAGQSRLTALADVPPDYVKLDRSLIRGLHQAQARQELVRALTRVSTDLGIQLIAEGIETPEEAEICLALGCHFAQGYFFGRPQPVSPTSV
jgi:EAL domain-containing protein (putative c-di-GMP-specific phosphodiesterase class I)